ncbi:DNA-directed DNA polymerase alpha catalytic subunit pol1, partial [Dipsacomyces acuminosporus]
PFGSTGGDDDDVFNTGLDAMDDAILDGIENLESDVQAPAAQETNVQPLYAEETEPQGQSWMDVQMEMAMNPEVSNQQTTAPGTATSSQEDGTVAGAVPTAGDMLYLYWFDAMEKNGNIYLFGKVPTNPNDSSTTYQSCCVKISGLERNLFLLPRINPGTSERFSVLEVHSEFESKALNLGITKFGCKPVQRKYAFEIPGIPTAAEYLKVIYGFDQPALAADFSGTTFECAFGTTYSALELFLLKRRMMGPCWLAISGARFVDAYNRLSWCRLEFEVDDPKNAAVMDDDSIAQNKLLRVPPLTTMTLSLKTVMNHKDNTNEVVAISMLVYRNISLDDPTPAAKRIAEQYTVVRQLTGIPLPADFQRLAQAQSKRGLPIEVTKTEGALLNFFAAILHRIDPDILVSHNFYGFDLDVLLHRMRALRTDGWSKLGRLRRTQWPKLQAGAGGMGESTFSERQIVAGRVVCDTYMASKDLIRAKSYSLTNLASQELQIKREEIPFERIPEHFGLSKTLLHFLRHTAFDAFLSASLMIHLQALPLTKQLTNLAGNLWSRTLMGARAERNEFLLLHEFYRNKFIRPDKFFGGQRPQPSAGGKQNGNAAANLKAEMAEAIDNLAAGGAEDDDDVDTPSAGAGAVPTGKSGRRKPAYLGGLVLEPKRGFYDRFVLLLDFNSLYPSIIQEYNICFTTVQRPENVDDIPDAPSPELAPGILPRLLKTLVERRRQVKQLLKKPSLSHEEAGQLDVRQKALKLTANSMYGCLGFTHSRFYAKPLAMLITSRGREILQATRDLALSEGLEVIYGDTDSIMIATRTETLADVYELGAQFKRRVNDRYKLLELDIDGVFKRLLLLKKKKYAALQIVNPEKHTKGEKAYATKLETKGLDLVRRDWCGLSHDVSDYVLKQLFADAPQQQPSSAEGEGMAVEQDEGAVIAHIHEHMSKVGNAVRNKQVPLDKYTIHKGLTKAPESYPDKKSQPHVLVALRLREKGVAVRSGDTIPYIICDPGCPGLNPAADGNSVQAQAQTSSGSYAERARHPDEIKESGGLLYPDADWYLNQQVLPPCARLLEPLAGTDMPTLAQHLGLDPSKFRSSLHSSSSGAYNDPDALRTLDSQISDAERFKFAKPFQATCQACKQRYEVSGIARHQHASDNGQQQHQQHQQQQQMLESGLVCTHCKHLPSAASLAIQLAIQIRGHVKEYYMFTMQCDEPSCGLQTRILSVAGSRCQRPQCSGRLFEAYSDKLLYHQLQYFGALLNVERSATRLGTTAAEVRAWRDRNPEHIAKLAKVVDSYLSVSARKFVDLSSLFSFCKI